MCGDIYCPSCGPAQGNSKCPHCGKWSFDGGCTDVKECEKKELARCEAEFRDYLIGLCLEIEAKAQNTDIYDLDLPKEWWELRNNCSVEKLKELAGK